MDEVCVVDVREKEEVVVADEQPTEDLPTETTLDVVEMMAAGR